MSWQTEMVEYVRVLVYDLDTTQIYPDDRLQRMILIASRQVLVELDVSIAYVVDIGAMNITPDPTVDRDDPFINLACLKAACLIDRGEAAFAAKRGIAFKEGGSSVDLRGPAQWRMKLLAVSNCEAYAQTKLEYQAGQITTAGAAIMGPIRLYAYGNYDYLGYGQQPGIEY